jgi:hypothetical protein
LDDGTFLEDDGFVHSLIPLRFKTAGLRLVWNTDKITIWSPSIWK